jgi:vitamin B12 transporter
VLSHRLLLVLVCTCTITIAADAQSSPSSADEFDNIVVTASRSPLGRPNVGSSTTVITHDQIERRQARYVTDLLRAVPGFAVSHSGTTGSQTQVRVRGAEANHVLVLIDGVRANDPASGDEFRWELLSTSNIERIEIVRGPQSSLWGSDAVAAVVHVITRKGSDRPTVGGFVEGGSNSTVNGGLDGGFGGDNWSLGLGIESLATDGSNISRSGTEDDDSDMTTASLNAQLLPSENVILNFGARAVDAYSQFDPIDFFSTGLPVDGDLATDSTQLFLNAGATINTFEGRIAHHLTARYLDTSNKNLVDGNPDSSTAAERTTFGYQTDIQMSENVLSLALEHERVQFEQRGQVFFGDPNQDQELTVKSAIADFQGNSFDGITWLLSARYDDNSDFDDALTGRLSLSWQVGDTTRLRANVGTGQKNPTFIERYGFFPSQFVGNPDLKPETSTSIDIGIEQSFADGALALEITWFNQDLEDEINGFVFDPNTFLFTAENVDGSSTRQGIEFAATYKVLENLEFAGSYTYTDSTEPDSLGNDIDELRRPRHSASLSTNYRFLNERAGILLVADYGGSRSDIFFPPFPAPSEYVTLASSWLVDLTASYDISGNMTAFARFTNLLDEEYEQVYGFATPGRAAFVGLRAGFGR